MRLYGKVDLDRQARVWRVTAEPHVLIRLKRVFNRIDKHEHGSVKLTDTPETCRELLWFLDRYAMEVKERDYLAARSTAFMQQSERIFSVIDGKFEPRAFNLALPLRRYQEVAAEATLQAGALLLADDLGIGKTASAIGVIAEPSMRPALVVTLTHLPKQWERELAKFAPGLKVHILKKGQPYSLTRRARRKDAPSLPGVLESDIPDVIISNYHKLSGWADVLAGKVKSVIFDECQELRHSGSGKYRAAQYIAEKCEVRMGLSATPIYNYGSEIYSILQVLSPLALGSYDEFVREWCVAGYSGDHHAVKDPKAFGLYLREQGLMLRRTRKDVGRELPPCIPIPHFIDADAAPLEAIEGAAAELARVILRQGGQARGEKLEASRELSWRLRQATGIAKAPHVADFVRMLVEQGEKVLLAGWHREVYSIWMERLKDLHPVMFTGSESPKQKQEAIDAFVKGEARVLVMSLRSGAGVDGLQAACRTVVHGELDWSPEVHNQLNGRPHRDGQEESVTAYYLVTDSGSDPVIADVLGFKRQQAEGIRDPSSAAVEPLTGGAANIRKLAESYLRERGLAIPEPTPDPAEEAA